MMGFIPARFLRNAAPIGAAFFFFLGLISLLALPVFGFSGEVLRNTEGVLIHEAPSLASNPAPVEGNLHIVAVMVEFQPDENPYTSGTGTFEAGAIPYLEDPGTSIDPLPHDRGHFEAHLEFAKRYFEYHSGDRLSISYQVLESIIRLPNSMEIYSPIGPDPDPAPLANLARDAWETLNLRGEWIDAQPEDDLLFVIFHAGIGRDIQLSGTTLDKTPQDIPSVYLSTNAFRELFDDPAFTGFPVQNSSRLISNTVILPRTNTRAGESITGETFLLPLSINGLLTAQIGSHLGLPDLFNTETGESGIGRFGLMDGAGIFSYNGLFPPELSAWEKIQLGWETPVEISPLDLQNGDPKVLELPAASLRQPDSIVKIPLSADEYYLLENRHRDPLDSGVTLTIRTPDGAIVEQTFTNQDSVFVFQNAGFDDLLTPGVVIDAQPYDFSLPGGQFRDGDTNRVLNGGILIWRVDESLIRARTQQNRGINDNPKKRGVEVMEADGARDIGRPVQLGFSQNEVNGSAFDFWFDGNNARVITQTGSEIILYENRFADDTTPSSRSHSGAPSFIELFDFSENRPVASLSLRATSPFPGWIEKVYQTRLEGSRFTNPLSARPSPARYPVTPIPYTTEAETSLLIPGNDSWFTFGLQDQQVRTLDVPIVFMQRQPLLLESLDQLLMLESSDTNPVQLQSYSLSNPGGNPLWSAEVDAGTNRNSIGLLSSDRAGRVVVDGTTITVNPITQTVDPNGFEEAVTVSELQEQEQVQITPAGIVEWTSADGTLQTSIPVSPGERLHLGWIDFPQAFLLTDHQLYRLLRKEGQLEAESLYESEAILGWPAIADISGDGTPDLMFIDPARNELIALHTTGAMLEFLPFHLPNGTLAGTPLVADLDGDQHMDILLMGYSESSTNLYLLDRELHPLEGSPLLVGGAPEQGEGSPFTPAIHGSELLAVSPAGDLTVWNFPAMGNRLWENAYGGQNNKVNGSLSMAVLDQPDFGVLFREETYNWPNPARDHTHIRFQLSGEGTVEVRITTSSGVPLFETLVNATGGMPEEIEIDTSDWASGGYLAQVIGTVNGTTERKLIKIAVVK